MGKHTPTPWVLEFDNKWPFSFFIKANGKHVISFIRVAHSTKQKTIDDVRSAYGFTPEERNEIIKLIEEQEANAEHIVKCINSHDELVEALTTLAEGINTLFDNRPHWTPTQFDKHLSDLHTISCEALKKAGV